MIIDPQFVVDISRAFLLRPRDTFKTDGTTQLHSPRSNFYLMALQAFVVEIEEKGEEAKEQEFDISLESSYFKTQSRLHLRTTTYNHPSGT